MPVGRGEGRHARIRLRVLEEPLFVRSVTVVYGNGETSEFNFRGALEPGESSPPLDLAGADRRRGIRQVVVSLRPQTRNRGTARLQLLGDGAAESGRAPVVDIPSAAWWQMFSDIPKGWVLFGTKEADFAANRDSIQVGREFGRFDKIAIRVRQNDVFIRDLRFVYANGESDTVEVRAGHPGEFADARNPAERRPLPAARRNHLSIAVRIRGARRKSNSMARSPATGWVSRAKARSTTGLDAAWSQSASMFKADSDAFAVGQQFGTFKKIQLTARRNKVDITGLQISTATAKPRSVPISGTLVRRRVIGRL